MALVGSQDLQGLSFDQHQRYATVRDLARMLRPHLPAQGADTPTLLDVGGFGRDATGRVRFPIRSLLPDWSTTIVDLAVPASSEASSAGDYAVAGGTALPFADGAFDIVVSCDTVEHLPAEERPGLIAELARVSRGFVIVAVPCGGPNVELAERIVSAFSRSRLGVPNPWLLEHSLYGLPSTRAILDAFEGASLETTDFAAEDLFGWLFMMLTRHYLQSVPDSTQLIEAADSIYCRYFGGGLLAGDLASRAYRRFFVGGKRPADPGIAEVRRWVMEAAQDNVPRASERSSDRESPALPLALCGLLLAASNRESEAMSAERMDIAVDHDGARPVFLSGDQSVSQDFASHVANLCRIDVLASRGAASPDASIVLHLRELDPSSRIVASARVSVATLPEHGWATLRFVPLLESRNRRYRAEVAVEPGAGKLGLHVYTNPAVDTGERPRPSDGSALEGHLAIRTFGHRTSHDEEGLIRLLAASRPVALSDPAPVVPEPKPDPAIAAMTPIRPSLAARGIQVLASAGPRALAVSVLGYVRWRLRGSKRTAS